MGGKTTHTIRKQEIRLGLESREKALNRQEAVRSLYYNRLLPQLEKLFDRYDIPGVTIRLDSIHLDLGDLPLEELERVFVEKACKAMEAELIKQLKSPSVPSGPRAVLVEADETWVQLVRGFLKEGRVPWWAGLQDLTPAGALEALVASKPEWVMNILAEVRTDRDKRLRLAWQFPSALRHKLIVLLAGSSARAVAIQVLQALEAVRPKGWAQWQPHITEALLLALLEAPAAFSTHTADTVGTEAEPSRQAAEGEVAQVPEVERGILPTGAAQEVFQRTVLHLARISRQSPATVLKAIASALAQRKKKGGLSASLVLLRKLLLAMDVEAVGAVLTAPDVKEVPVLQRPRIFDAPPTIEEETYIPNAGIVILAAFLQPFFTQVGLVENRAFVSEDAQAHALTILHYLASGDNEPQEENQLLDKLLCGWPAERPVPPSVPLGPSEMEEADSLLASVVEYWKALGSITPDGLRASFLQREGKLRPVANGWALHVNRLTFDVLLDQLPWSISVVTLPWMSTTVFVNW